MSTNRPMAVAGRFYPSSASDCVRMMEEMRRPAEVDGELLGGIVPHAGWVYSGPTAMLTIAALAAAKPETVVIFGAVHRIDQNHASLYARGGWDTPVGPLMVDEELAAAFAAVEGIVADEEAHAGEHSIEVQMPLIRHILGDVKVVPISVRSSERAAEIGRKCAAASRKVSRRVVWMGSTDLTHYGPAFGFMPSGHGEAGVRWSKEVNDRRLVRLVEELNADGIVAEASMNRNACGAGAVAATVAAMQELGARQYVELEHITSAEVEGRNAGNAVGYEAGVFVRA